MVDDEPHITREMLERRVRRDFGDANTATILSALDQYGVEAYQLERERVQMAILKLSQGKWEMLEHCVRRASTDYRDVLLYAEYPSAAGPRPSNLPTPEEAQRAAQADADAYRDWLTDDGVGE